MSFRRQFDSTFKKKFGISVKKAHKLGEGNYGEVYQVTEKKTGITRAVKVIQKKKLYTLEDKTYLQAEIRIHTSLDHEHIVKMVDVFNDKKSFYLVLEIMQGGELFETIVKEGSFSERKAAIVTRNITEALHYLHKQNIVHRDLKPENLLLVDDTSDTNLKLADFGFATNCDEPLYAGCGTITYIAPEILRFDPYKQEVDIWSLGVIVYSILCGYAPFFGNSDEVLVQSISEGKFEFEDRDWKDISDDAKDLVKQMLTMDQKERITAEHILEHPWVKNAESNPDVAISAIAENMRKEAAKRILNQALAGAKAIDNMRKLLGNLDANREVPGKLGGQKILKELEESMEQL